MRKILLFKTKVGTFYIAQSPDGRFHPMYKEETYGSYQTAQEAVDALTGGHTFSISGVDDTSSIGLPDDLSAWLTFTK